jgi:hypothetical protein
VGFGISDRLAVESLMNPEAMIHVIQTNTSDHRLRNVVAVCPARSVLGHEAREIRAYWLTKIMNLWLLRERKVSKTECK